MILDGPWLTFASLCFYAPYYGDVFVERAHLQLYGGYEVEPYDRPLLLLLPLF